MKLIDVTKQFTTDDKCLDYIEKMRWPNGVCCIHCGVLTKSLNGRTANVKRPSDDRVVRNPRSDVTH